MKLVFILLLILNSGYNHPAIVKVCEDPKMIVSLLVKLLKSGFFFIRMFIFQSVLANRPALGMHPPLDFAEKLNTVLMSVSI